ncbi:polysaccharide pyruvyl transferase family protein [Pseudomonas sp. R5(2019)]|uniref:polysaccharide pyruvyl transferase family protein n=1 Tax=Pseudomonas sp. R5(2019) TaxID=2697566 RepID=UPI001411C3E6|nr:polysaccharide pyruvyl transferase family protein [Pseudomonas sp. R5(2019)]NBA98226.1 polysaccharide pyruvyl transferase family protein [Pseudomonas sp. R5(2019)]
MTDVKKICLAWHNFNSCNYGVSALAIAHLNMVLKAAGETGANIEIQTLGTHNVANLSIKEELENNNNIKISHVNYSTKQIAKDFLKLNFSAVKSFKKYDLVLDIGEGDSFTDIYGLKRFLNLSSTKFISIIFGKKLCLSPQTIGPFNHKLSKIVAAWLMKRSKYVFSRDGKSTHYAKELGVNAIEVCDVAFSLPYQPQTKIPNSVGINVSGLLWNGGYSGNNQFNLKVDYKSLIQKTIEGFLTRGKQVHLIAHVIADDIPVEDDFRVCEEIKKRFQENHNVILAPKFKSPTEAKSYISSLHFFTGARMHATIGALSSGVVTIPLAYSRKFAGVFDSLGYPYTLSAYDLDTESILTKTFELHDHVYDEMEAAMARARALSKQKNLEYVNYLKELIINA